MTRFNPHFVVDTSGTQIAQVADNGHDIIDQRGNQIGVLLGTNEYTNLMEELEDLRELREAYARLLDENDEVIPFSQAIAEIEAEERAQYRPALSKSIDECATVRFSGGTTDIVGRERDDDEGLLERGSGNY